MGGSGSTSHGQGIAAVGSQVYVTGFITATSSGLNATFGGSGTQPSTVQQAGASTAYDHDLVVAKYLDNGATASVAWTQVGGGLKPDQGNAIAVQGIAVYVTGLLNSSSTNGNQVVFGGSGTTPGTAAQPGAGPYASDDVVVTKYVDQGTGVAATGTGLYVVGYAKVPATFGSFTLAGPVSSTFGFLCSFGATALPVLAAAAPGLALYPNPALPSCAARRPVLPCRCLDALGRRVAATQADAAGTAHLPTIRLTVEICQFAQGWAQMLR